MCCPSITVAARKSRLGDKFRGKFYRLNDDKHTEEKFCAELAVVGVQISLSRLLNSCKRCNDCMLRSGAVCRTSTRSRIYT